MAEAEIKKATGMATDGQKQINLIKLKNTSKNSHGQELIEMAQKFLGDGLSVIPCNPETKRPTLEAWKPYQTNLISSVDLFQWPGIALICGEVSGNLECLDFDFKAAWFNDWKTLVVKESPELLARLLNQRTQSEGKHIAFRCTEPIPGNQRLATDVIQVKLSETHKKNGKRFFSFQKKELEVHEVDGKLFVYPCYIETRGQGGYFLAAPTSGYSITHGDFLDLPIISAQEREILINSARALNRKPPDPERIFYQSNNSDQRPGDLYNEQADLRPLLEQAGWKLAGSRGNLDHFTRPGKAKGISASLYDGKVFHVFSSNATPFELDKSYAPFSVYTLLKHGGDYEAAAKDLKRQGYGDDPTFTTGENDQKPEPLPLARKNEPGEPYPINALGPIMGPATKKLIEIIQAPDAVCAHSVLSAASLTVQAFGDILIDGRRKPVSEYFLSICPRSERKTSTDTAATSEIRAWEEEQMRQYGKDFKAYCDDLLAYEAQKKKIISNKKIPFSEKSRELSLLRESEPVRPIEPLVLVLDNTFEGLIKRFSFGRSSKGLFADEGGVFSGGFSMTPEKILYSASGYSRLWDGASIDKVRAGEEVGTLYGRRLTVHLMMQDQVADDFFNNKTLKDQGLLSRFLVAYPPSKTGTRKYVARDPNESPELMAYHARIKELLDKQLPLKVDPQSGAVLNELAPPTINLTPEAKGLWVEFYHAVEENCGTDNQFEAIPGFSGKAAEHCFRLAGIMALFESPNTNKVEKDHIMRAATLIEYYLNERIRIRNIAAPNKELKRAQELLDWLRATRKKRVELQEIYQKGPYKLRTAKEARIAVKVLVEHFWLSPVLNKKNQWSTHEKIQIHSQDC